MNIIFQKNDLARTETVVYIQFKMSLVRNKYCFVQKYLKEKYLNKISMRFKFNFMLIVKTVMVKKN